MLISSIATVSFLLKLVLQPYQVAELIASQVARDRYLRKGRILGGRAFRDAAPSKAESGKSS